MSSARILTADGVLPTAYGLLGIACLLEAGCRRSGPHGPGTPAAQPARVEPGSSQAGGPAVTDYPLRGVVRSVTPESGQVLIRHEAIPGFMSAMTMPFKPVNPAILATLQPGDRVEGTLRVETADGAVKEHQLLDLKVTEPAERFRRARDPGGATGPR